MSSAILTPEEVVRLTGYERPSFQARFCRLRGIHHFINASGEVVIPVSALDPQQGQIYRQFPEYVAPNFDQFSAVRTRPAVPDAPVESVPSGTPVKPVAANVPDDLIGPVSAKLFRMQSKYVMPDFSQFEK